MSISINNLSDLLKDHVKKLYSSEQQLISAVPTIARNANSEALKKDIAAYMAIKEKNFKRLKECFQDMALPVRGQKCELAEDLIENCQATVSQSAEAQVMDAALISTLQQINHFSIATYGTAASFAKTLGKDNTSELLHQALEDEKRIDRQLSRIAEETVNPSAVLA